jgi:hypothetical protein
MRLATFTMAVLGLLTVGAAMAVAHEGPASSAIALAAAADRPAVTPVRWYPYGPGPVWYGHHHYRPWPYYTYRPRYYWGGDPCYGDYAVPYTGYYQPYGFGFQFNGPRRSFSFGF